MKNYVLLILLSIALLSSCHENPNRDNIPPTEPCTNLSWSTSSVGTHGYVAEKFDTVIIQTYVKNSHFDSLVATFKVLNNGEINDKQRQSKSFSLPEEITTDFDLLIVMGKRDSFEITKVKTGWVPRMCQSFCGYSCTITTLLINGEREGWRIFLRNPNFEYHHEYLARKRKELKDSSEYGHE